jgi:hypothetical protein
MRFLAKLLSSTGASIVRHRAAVAAGAVAVLIVLAGLAYLPKPSGPSSRTTSSESTVGPVADPRSKDLHARARDLTAALKAVEDGERESPRDRWDPVYVVDALGPDPRTLFDWVRDNTSWIAYRGQLRGPIGVLMDRQGNSLDRAVLLATLLESAGHTVRLAHGQLTRQHAFDVLPLLVADRTAAFATQGLAIPEGPSAVQQVASEYRLDGVALNQQLQDQAQVVSRIFSELDARVVNQTGRLLKALQRPDDEDVRSQELDAAITALTDHWWVQRESGGTWVDLDLLDTNGAALTAPTETMVAAAVSSEQHHEIAVRVIAEQWADGKISEHAALEHTLRPADLIGRSVVVQFWPTARVDPQTTLPPASDWRSDALSHYEWDAVLAVDAQLQASATIPDTGEDPFSLRGGPFGGIGRAMSGLAPGSGEPEARTLSAVWLEYEIRVPGEKPRTVRRAVFDLIGPANRASGTAALVLDDEKKVARSLALTMQTEMLPLASALAPEFVRHLLARNLLDNRDLFAVVLRGTPVSPETIEQVVDRSALPLSALYPLALVRLTQTEQQQRFLDRPNLLTRHMYAVPSPQGVRFRDATDIVANEIGVSLAADDAFAARVAQGVRDTNAESLLRASGVGFGNAGDAFAASRSWRALATHRDTGVAGQLQLPNDVRRLIAADVVNGYTVVAPESPVLVQPEAFSGWWRIDPNTGSTLGLGANGWGTAMSEDGANTAPVARTAPVWKARMKMFMVAFSMNYGWCIAPFIQKEMESGWKLGLWEGAIKPSVGECTGDSVFIAAVTAFLLPVRVVPAGVAARRALGGGATPKSSTGGRAGGARGGAGGATPESQTGAGKSGRRGEAGGGAPPAPSAPEGAPGPGPEPGPPPPEPPEPCKPGGEPTPPPEFEGPPTRSEMENQLTAELRNADAREAEARAQYHEALHELIDQKIHKPFDPPELAGPDHPGDPSKFDQAKYDAAKVNAEQARQNLNQAEGATYDAEQAYNRFVNRQLNKGTGVKGRCGGIQVPGDATNPRATTQPVPAENLAKTGPVDAQIPADALPRTEPVEVPIPAEALPKTEPVEVPMPAEALPKTEPVEVPVPSDAKPSGPTTQPSTPYSAPQGDPGTKTMTGVAGASTALGK